jgi:hypothetical protein
MRVCFLKAVFSNPYVPAVCVNLSGVGALQADTKVIAAVGWSRYATWSAQLQLRRHLGNASPTRRHVFCCPILVTRLGRFRTKCPHNDPEM